MSALGDEYRAAYKLLEDCFVGLSSLAGQHVGEHADVMPICKAMYAVAEALRLYEKSVDKRMQNWRPE